MPTRTIPHSRPEGYEITDFHDTPKRLCNRTQAEKFISRHPICLTDYKYDYILEEIGRQEN